MRLCSILDGNRHLRRHLWTGTATGDLLTGGFKNSPLPAPKTKPRPTGDRHMRRHLCLRTATCDLITGGFNNSPLPAPSILLDLTGDRHMRRHLCLWTGTCDSGNRRLSLKTATGDIQTAVSRTAGEQIDRYRHVRFGVWTKVPLSCSKLNDCPKISYKLRLSREKKKKLLSLEN